MNLLKTPPTSFDPNLFNNYCWRLDASLEIRIVCCSISTNTVLEWTPHSVSDCYVNCGNKKWFFSTWPQYFSSCFYSCSVLRTPRMRSMRSSSPPCWSAETPAQSTIWRRHSGSSVAVMDSQTLGGMASLNSIIIIISIIISSRALKIRYQLIESPILLFVERLTGDTFLRRIEYFVNWKL